MGFDWEDILDADGDDLADAWEDRVYQASRYDDYDDYDDYSEDEYPEDEYPEDRG